VCQESSVFCAIPWAPSYTLDPQVSVMFVNIIGINLSAKDGDPKDVDEVHCWSHRGIKEWLLLFVALFLKQPPSILSRDSCSKAVRVGQLLMLEVQRTIYAQEGSINKCLVDDKVWMDS
jgi:hypothetical protein